MRRERERWNRRNSKKEQKEQNPEKDQKRVFLTKSKPTQALTNKSSVLSNEMASGATTYRDCRFDVATLYDFQYYVNTLYISGCLLFLLN